MKRILICTSVLGGGTALVFAAAALAATLAPAGVLVPSAWQQTGVMRRGPAMFGGGMMLQDGSSNNFGGVTVTGTVGSGNAPAPAVDLPLPVPAIATEAP
jgi:hypothetical protein